MLFIASTNAYAINFQGMTSLERSDFDAEAIQLDFDELPAELMVGNTYESKGLLFENTKVKVNGYYVSSPNDIAPAGAPIRINIPEGAEKFGIQIDTDGYTLNRQPQMRAFDQNGDLLGIINFGQGADFVGMKFADKLIYSILLCHTDYGAPISSSTYGFGDDYDNLIFEKSSTTLNVDLDPDWIELKETGGQDGSSDKFDPAKITITVKDTWGNPMKQTEVRIRAITVPGSGGHSSHYIGGEYNEMLRSFDSQTDSQQITRPMAKLTVNQETGSNDITAITDNSGKVQVTYKPPTVLVGDSALERVVAGKDTITVTLVNNPEIKQLKQISYGYVGFVDFSKVDFSDENVNLKRQDNHDYEFWCTADTSKSMQNIAKKFKEQTGRSITITAMSLQYGGLSDIDGEWSAPHVTHSNGKCVDVTKNGLISDESLISDDIDKLKALYLDDLNHRRPKLYDEPDCLHFSFKS